MTVIMRRDNKPRPSNAIAEYNMKPGAKKKKAARKASY